VVVLILVVSGLFTRVGSGAGTAIALGTCAEALMGIIQLLLDASGRRLDRQFGLISREGSSLAFSGVIETGRWLISFVAGCAIAALCVVYAGAHWPWVLIALVGAGVLLRLLLRGRPTGVEVPVDGKWLTQVQATFAAKRMPEIPNLVVIDIGETTLAGGRCGLLGRRLWISRAVAELQPQVSATLIAREVAHTSHRHTMISAIISFLTLALSIGLAFALLRLTQPSLTLHAPSVVLALSSIVTLCSFASLFILPAIGRAQVTAVDQWIARHFGCEAALAMLDALAARNLPNDALDQVKAYVFHPIPTMSARRASVQALQTTKQINRQASP